MLVVGNSVDVICGIYAHRSFPIVMSTTRQATPRECGANARVERCDLAGGHRDGLRPLTIGLFRRAAASSGSSVNERGPRKTAFSSSAMISTWERQ